MKRFLKNSIWVLAFAVWGGCDPETSGEVRIEARYPAAVSSSDTLVLRGQNFGDSPGTVKVGDQPAKVLKWTPAEVQVRPPTAAEGVCAPIQLWNSKDNASNVVHVTTGERNFLVPLSEVPTGGGRAAVWTGREMFIFDGGTNSGWRYNPRLDSWLKTAPLEFPGGNPQALPFDTDNVKAIFHGYRVFLWGHTWNPEQRQPLVAQYDLEMDAWSPVTREGAPDPLPGQTVTNTGRELIVFGGGLNLYCGGVGCYCKGCDTKPQGGIFSLDDESWRSISLSKEIGAEALDFGRFNHSAIWTGSELIVWGGSRIGENKFVNLNTGLAYNVETGRWRALPSEGAPSTRENHFAVWTGNEMIVWGGVGQDIDTGLSDGAAYNPVTNQWRPIAESPQPWVSGGAVWTGEQMLTAGDRTSLAYDPAEDRWFELGGPAPGAGQSVVWTGQELLSWGGYKNGSRQASGSRYRPSTGQWLTIKHEPNAPQFYGGSSVTWTGTEFIVWGSIGDGKLAQGARFDPALNQWRPIAQDTQLLRRWGHKAVWTGNKLLVVGGVPDDWDDSAPPALYDPALDSWQILPGALGAHEQQIGHDVVWAGDRAIILGGRYIALSLVPETGQWGPLPEWYSVPSTIAALENVRMAGLGVVGAVWTGEDVILVERERLWFWEEVHGGEIVVADYSEEKMRASKYSLATNQWLPMAQPPDESLLWTSHEDPWHKTTQLVWTGSALYMMGYADRNGTREAVGAKYMPATDSWQTLNLQGAPAGGGLAAASNGDDLMVYSGNQRTNGAGVSIGGFVWSESQGTWSETSTGCTRDSFAVPSGAAWLGDRFFILGSQGPAAYIP